MLLVGLWHGDLSDESVEDMTNANLHAMHFLGLDLADDVPDHSALSRFRTRLMAAQAYGSRKHREALKALGIKNGIQDKAVKNEPLAARQLQRNQLITRLRYVVERTFGSQARWFNAKILHYRGLAKAHAWHVLKAMAYNLKRLPRVIC